MQTWSGIVKWEGIFKHCGRCGWWSGEALVESLQSWNAKGREGLQWEVKRLQTWVKTVGESYGEGRGGVRACCGRRGEFPGKRWVCEPPLRGRRVRAHFQHSGRTWRKKVKPQSHWVSQHPEGELTCCPRPCQSSSRNHRTLEWELI